MNSREDSKEVFARNLENRYEFPNTYFAKGVLLDMSEALFDPKGYMYEHLFVLASMIKEDCQDELRAFATKKRLTNARMVNFSYMFNTLNINVRLMSRAVHHLHNTSMLNAPYHTLFNTISIQLKREHRLPILESMCLDTMVSYLAIHSHESPTELYSAIMYGAGTAAPIPISYTSGRSSIQYDPSMDDTLDAMSLATSYRNVAANQRVHSPSIDQEEYDKRALVHKHIIGYVFFQGIQMTAEEVMDDNEFEVHHYHTKRIRGKKMENSSSKDLLDSYGDEPGVLQLVKYEKDNEYLKDMFTPEIEQYLHEANVPVLTMRNNFILSSLLRHMPESTCKYINSASPLRSKAYWVCPATRTIYDKIKHAKSGSEYIELESALNYIQERFGIDTVWINGNGDMLLLETLSINRLKSIAKTNQFNINKLSMKVAMKLGDKRLRTLLNIAELKSSYINKLLKSAEIKESLTEPPKVTGKRVINWSK